MSTKVEPQGSRMDIVKLLIAGLLLVGAAVGFNYYQDHSLLMRVLGMLVVLGVSLTIAMQTERGRTSWGFVKDARTEVRKVVWPTWTETVQTTLVVIVMVIVVAFILWLMDGILLWAVKELTGQGS